ncbi:hypothetical protein ACEPAI_8396 [Sanghuangporus weigelae]
MDNDCRTPKAYLSSLHFISPSILAELASLNLTGRLSKTRKVISGGAYGDISKGHFRSPGRRVKVAVKCLRFYLKEDIKTLFEREIYVWSKLDHENILPLMGYAIDTTTGFPLLVSRWMENGSAWTYVNSHPNPDVLQLQVTGIASGLAYLHRNGVVHSDIKSDNVLVSASGNALICDFGCSRMVAASRSLANLSSGIRGTSRYLAFELVAPVPSCHTQKTDVWAFGMTVYELAFRQRPFAGLTDFQVISAIMHYELPRLPTLDPFDHHFERKGVFRAICVDCWKPDPVDRPDISAISNKLTEEQKAPQIWTLPMSNSDPILMRNMSLPSSLFNSRFYAEAEMIEHNCSRKLSEPVSFEVSERARDADDFLMKAHVSNSKHMLRTLDGRKPKRTRSIKHGLGYFTSIQQKKYDENIDPDCSCTPCTQLRCRRLGTKYMDWMHEWDDEKIKAFLAKNEEVKSSSTFTDNELCDPISFPVPVCHDTSGENEDSVHGDGTMNRCTNSVDIGCGESRNSFGMDLLNFSFAGNISPGI